MSRWYCDAFGMQVVARNDVGRRGVLIGFDGAAPGASRDRADGCERRRAGAGEHRSCGAGWRHVAIRVSDFDRAYARLKELGVCSFTTEPHEAMGGGRRPFVRDPEGNELQIVQREATD
jgi:glyoxylase I family protein